MPTIGSTVVPQNSLHFFVVVVVYRCVRYYYKFSYANRVILELGYLNVQLPLLLVWPYLPVNNNNETIVVEEEDVDAIRGDW